ncbi:uncharacterized protein M421DRAFT_394688 [Didymella exigua CBS 183.55]|uniref:Uncharacterized protein n=1 Tax=Didymella exigua CBS 183.55 TaxID=1150837 RepID=A0A6A5RFC4_9PLEO|nr:uncharacterized protein M421DRAFT_394688 [Didymella exigua CBS 183.55]KAF1926975.1 hypothetical protein M421DRAFT_394688 [Didymella exigua CBS 183.55]
MELQDQGYFSKYWPRSALSPDGRAVKPQDRNGMPISFQRHSRIGPGVIYTVVFLQNVLPRRCHTLLQSAEDNIVRDFGSDAATTPYEFRHATCFTNQTAGHDMTTTPSIHRQIPISNILRSRQKCKHALASLRKVGPGICSCETRLPGFRAQNRQPARKVRSRAERRFVASKY